MTLIGANGAGKSSTLRALSGSSGRRAAKVTYKGRTSRASRRTRWLDSASHCVRKVVAYSHGCRCTKTC